MRKKLFSVLLSLSLLCNFTLMPVVAHAALADEAKKAACQGVNFDATKSTCDADAETKVESRVGDAIDIFANIIGIIAVIMIMVGGIKYMTSQGDPTQTNNAKNTIIYAGVGLVVAVLARIIVRYVLYSFA